MSFRARLTSFFVLIVVIPMVAVGFLVFRLISDSQHGKADARVSGLATAAHSLYLAETEAASADAQAVARLIGSSPLHSIPATAARLTSQFGLARVLITSGSHTIADVGTTSAVAPGIATLIAPSGHATMSITASELNASQYISDLSAPGVVVVVKQGSRPLASTRAAAGRVSLPKSGTVHIGSNSYSVVTQTLPGFGAPVSISVLSSVAATGGSLAGSRALAAGFIVAVLLLAFSFSILASRGLQGQVSRFLQAARRLAGGDFSSTIPIEGRDEFAALGEEFNNMSSQLERRLGELSRERARLRDAIGRIGQTFASNLDRPALMELALKTAIDAVEAEAGRITARESSEQPLVEIAREGSFDGFGENILAAERVALQESSGVGEVASDAVAVMAARLAAIEPGQRTHGVITVVSRNRRFSEDEREVLRSLAAEATLALENVDLHMQVSRQAVTDELTGLANHGRFQELLDTELEQVRRYHHPVGLIMLDIDNFKSINDTYGHQQGDVVLKRVARVLADTSREADFPARYGGEEMALILPHTDLEGAYAIAERIRTRIEAIRIPRNDGEGTLRVTASLGVSASRNAEKDELVAEADNALYEAKRSGKNRCVKAGERSANVLSAG